ncbi:MAG TPA: hypothetical protein VLC47_09015 [Burkholderiales bacterium]|nr:hypothetical protein [Burkholderiales bacterium]
MPTPGAGWRAVLLVALASCLAAVPVRAADWRELGVNVYGLSYHFDRDRAKQLDADNSLNPGLGLRYDFAQLERWTFFADGGAYYDSGRNTAVYGGVGALWQVVGGLKIGGALAVMNSDTYNDGDTFLAPLPLVAYDFGPFMVNLTFFPKISKFNEVATLGLWFTLWPGKW